MIQPKLSFLNLRVEFSESVEKFYTPKNEVSEGLSCAGDLFHILSRSGKKEITLSRHHRASKKKAQQLHLLLVKKRTKQKWKEAIKMQANILITVMAIGITLGYLAVVMVPLVATIFGGIKLLGLRKEKEGVILFQEGLGFTMADGGEKEKKEE